MRKWMIALLMLLQVSMLQAGKIDRAFEALNEFNYFKAKELFEKVKDKDVVAATFGLSIIYGRNDNPFYHLDSAFKYISMADTNFLKIDEKDIEDLHELGVDSTKIESWKDSIDHKVFIKVKAESSVSSYQSYLDKHLDSDWRDEAKSLRNNLAFQLAKEKNSSIAYQAFMNQYPNAEQFYEAQNRYEERLYKEKTAGGKLEDYKYFVKHHPESPYLKEAQDSVYSLSTPNKMIQEYERFIEVNPENPNVDEAWRNIYKLYTSDYSPQRIVEFRIDYPDYPFVNELVTDMKLAVMPFLPYKQNGLWGFMDTLGKVMIPAKYQSVESFQEGLALAVKDGKVGYINKSGETVVPFEYDEGEPFQSGRAVVSQADFFGLIDRTNSIVVPFKYEFIGPFNSGLAVVANDTAYGYVNGEGEVTIPVTLEYADDFQHGYAVIDLKGKKGIINTMGKQVIPAKYQWLEAFNKFGLARAKNDSLYGIVDKNGAEVVPFIYDRIGEYSDGLAMVVKQGKYGYVNYKGQLVIDLKFDFKLEALIWGKFKNAHAKYFLKDKFGILDTTGEKVFPAIFEDVGEYHPTEWVAVKKRGSWGYSDHDLRLKIPYRYDYAETFHEGIAKVKREGKWGFLNREENWIISPEYDKAERVDSLLILNKGNKWGVMTIEQDTLLPFNYDGVGEIEMPYLEVIQAEQHFQYHLIQNKLIKPQL